MRHENTMTKNSIPKYLPFLICILASMFYLYEFVLQVSPSVMTNQLMRDFGIEAAGVSMISAFYYYAYTPMQIVAGLLYDRFGPRRVLTAAILICAAGAYFFSTTQSIAMASAGRFLMGMGSAFSFIGALMLVSRWFPPQYFAFIAGIVQLMSSIGAISGQIPIAAAVNHFGWRETLLWVAVFGVALSLVISLIVRDHPPGVIIPHHHNQKGELQRLKNVMGKKQTWYTGIYAFCSWGPIVVFACLWGIPYLAERFNVTTTVASTACAMIWLGIGIGSPLIGWVSDHIKSRRKPLIISAALTFVTGLAVLYFPGISFNGMFILLFFFGMAASGQALSFALVKDINTHCNVGTAIGFNNMAVVLGGALLQPLAGVILRNTWAGQMMHDVPFYTISNYAAAMSIMPLCGALGLVLSIFFIKETHCRPVEDITSENENFMEKKLSCQD